MERKKKSLLKKLAITTAIVITLLMGLTYACFSMFFKDHYFYSTTINGNNYSYKTPVEAEEQIYRSFNDYSLEITGREGVYDVIFPAEIDLTYIFDDSLVKIKREQNPGLWILGFFKEYSYDIPQLVEYNEDALEQKIQRLAFFKQENIRAPSDAYIDYSPGEKQYMIVKSSPGTAMENKKAAKAIRAAINSLEKHLDLEEAGCYKTAAVSAENETLRAALEQANRYVQTKITYDWNGGEVFVDADVVRGFIVLKKDKAVLDEEKIREFVAQQAKKYDTYGKNRIFQTTDGREIELKSGAYGWRTDKDAEAEALLASIQKGETVKKEPAYSYTAAQSGEKDIGNTYVEIDLGNQHLYLYVDGAIVLESDFVSGNESRGWNTPAGIFGLTYKTRNAVLKGEGYATPVNYWMPFNGNIGMHDATWRGSFGGEIYKTNGSHGCINLPHENAEIIYEYLYTGFPVVCYY